MRTGGYEQAIRELDGFGYFAATGSTEGESLELHNKHARHALKLVLFRRLHIPVQRFLQYVGGEPMF